MGPKGPSVAQLQPSLQHQQQRQQQQQRLLTGRMPSGKTTADDALSNGSGDDEMPLPLVDQMYLSDKKFVEFSISPNSKRALAEVLKYDRCSLVQAVAIPICLGPDDIIAKAKTGTGKTLAFVIPTIEKVLSQRAPAGKVSALVLSPTRELARQIQTETHKMLTFHSGLHSMVVYGGVDVKKHVCALNQQMPDILIATPGRCWDIMTQPHDCALASLLDSTRVLVLDEADNLLDMGFRPQISRILGALPPTNKRQTFLFSATFPEDVKSLADVALKRQHRYVDAVGEDVATHTHVEASSLVVAPSQLPLQLLLLIAAHVAQEPEYKIIVFLPTANLTAYFAEAFSAVGLHGVLEIHSRKSQAQRDRASAQFRGNSRLVMFSSDVSARGVDYPNVTYVIQLGAPANREQYIHRAGRTGRAGRPGQGTLLLAEFERPFLDRLQDLPITPLQPLQLPLPTLLSSQGGGRGSTPMSPLSDALVRDPVGALTRVAGRIEYSSRARAYQSFLGYYKSHEVLKLRHEQVVGLANQYAVEVLGCSSPPGLLAKTVWKMGLKGTPGLVIVKEGQQGQPPPAPAVVIGPPPTPDQAAAAAAAVMGSSGSHRAGGLGRGNTNPSQQPVHQGLGGAVTAPTVAGNTSSGMRSGRANGAQQQPLQGPGVAGPAGVGSMGQGSQSLGNSQAQARVGGHQSTSDGGQSGSGEAQSLPRSQAPQIQAQLLPQTLRQQNAQSGQRPMPDQQPQAPLQQQQNQMGGGPAGVLAARNSGLHDLGEPVTVQPMSTDSAGPALPPGLGLPIRGDPTSVSGPVTTVAQSVGSMPASSVGQSAAQGVEMGHTVPLPPWNPQASASGAAPNNIGMSCMMRSDIGMPSDTLLNQQQQLLQHQFLLNHQPMLHLPQQQMHQLQIQQHTEATFQKQYGPTIACARDGQVGVTVDSLSPQQQLQSQQQLLQLQAPSQQQAKQEVLQQQQQLQQANQQQLQQQQQPPFLQQHQQNHQQLQKQHGINPQPTDAPSTGAEAGAMAAAAAAISGHAGLPSGAHGTVGFQPPGGAHQTVSAEYAVLAAMLNMPTQYGFIQAQQQQQAQALQHMQAQVHSQSAAHSQARATQTLPVVHHHQNETSHSAPPTGLGPHQLMSQTQHAQVKQQQQQQILQFAHAQAAAMAGFGSLPGRGQVLVGGDAPGGTESGIFGSGQPMAGSAAYQYRHMPPGLGVQTIGQDIQELGRVGGAVDPSVALLNLANLGGMHPNPREAAGAAGSRSDGGSAAPVPSPQHIQQTAQQQHIMLQMQQQQQQQQHRTAQKQRATQQQQQPRMNMQQLQPPVQQQQQMQQVQQQPNVQQKQRTPSHSTIASVSSAPGASGSASGGRQQQGLQSGNSRQQPQMEPGVSMAPRGPRGGPQGGGPTGGRPGSNGTPSGTTATQGQGDKAPTRWWHKRELKDQAAEITERVASAKSFATGGDATQILSKQQIQQQQQQKSIAGPVVGAVLNTGGVNGQAAAGRPAQQQQLLQASRSSGGAAIRPVGGSVTRPPAGPTGVNPNSSAVRGQNSLVSAAAAAAAVATDHAQVHMKSQQPSSALSLQHALLQQQQAAQQQQILIQQQMLQYSAVGHQAPYFLVGHQPPLTSGNPQTSMVFATALQQQQQQQQQPMQLTPAQQHHLQQQLTPMQLQQLQHMAPAQQQFYLQQLALGVSSPPECKQQ